MGLKAAALAGQRTRIADYVALTKPRIMALLLITAFCGMVVAAHGWPAWGLAVQTLGGLALSVGGAHAVNMWFDADIDGLMDRTRARPIPAGRMAPEKALWMGVGLGIISFIWLWTRVNPWAAGLAFCGYLYYVLVYTMWLKRTTPQNIVIGGGAGAFPPLVGWAAVTGHLGWAAWVLFGIVFLWTPPHFWALALYRRREYARAAVPMLPVTHGPRATKGQMIGYAAALLPVSWLLARVAPVGWLYLVVAATAGLALLGACMRLWFEPDDRDQWARRTFFLSLWYLTAVFGAMVADVVLRA
ncbi:MAG: heme o synthase [Firmicutes bacterium]|nr:protoheme IX farnesyltransferase [Alicyclobacillaceae bacterium]MCL6497654.1 heme o synthase [Bacillota bacterium]